MIDKIDLRKDKISGLELKQVISKANLKPSIRNGKTKYSNKETKNFDGGFFITVSEKGELKAVGSVHKFYNYLQNNKLDNYNRFSLKQAKETIYKIMAHYGILETGLKVRAYEIGVNIILDFEPNIILDNLLKIDERQYFTHPFYKNKSYKTTYTNRDFRHVYAVYDKLFEMEQKQRNKPQGTPYIIRLEHKVRRNYKLTLTHFLSPANLQKLFDNFKNDFSKMRFKPNIKYTGVGYSSQIKINTARLIIMHGTKEAKRICKNLHDIGETSKSNYRTQREFIRDWFKLEHFKNYQVIPKNESENLTDLLNIEYQALNPNKSKQ